MTSGLLVKICLDENIVDLEFSVESCEVVYLFEITTTNVYTIVIADLYKFAGVKVCIEDEWTAEEHIMSEGSRLKHEIMLHMEQLSAKGENSRAAELFQKVDKLYTEMTMREMSAAEYVARLKDILMKIVSKESNKMAYVFAKKESKVETDRVKSADHVEVDSVGRVKVADQKEVENKGQVSMADQEENVKGQVKVADQKEVENKGRVSMADQEENVRGRVIRADQKGNKFSKSKESEKKNKVSKNEDVEKVDKVSKSKVLEKDNKVSKSKQVEKEDKILKSQDVEKGDKFPKNIETGKDIKKEDKVSNSKDKKMEKCVPNEPVKKGDDSLKNEVKDLEEELKDLKDFILKIKKGSDTPGEDSRVEKASHGELSRVEMADLEKFEVPKEVVNEAARVERVALVEYNATVGVCCQKEGRGGISHGQGSDFETDEKNAVEEAESSGRGGPRKGLYPEKIVLQRIPKFREESVPHRVRGVCASRGETCCVEYSGSMESRVGRPVLYRGVGKVNVEASACENRKRAAAGNNAYYRYISGCHLVAKNDTLLFLEMFSVGQLHGEPGVASTHGPGVAGPGVTYWVELGLARIKEEPGAMGIAVVGAVLNHNVK